MKRVITASSSDNSYNYKGYFIKDMGSYFDVCDGPKSLYTAETSKDAEKFVDGLDVKSCTNVRSFTAVPGKGIQATKVQAADEPWPPTITYNEYEEGDQPIECWFEALDRMGLTSEASGQATKGEYFFINADGETVGSVDMDEVDAKILKLYNMSAGRAECISDMMGYIQYIMSGNRKSSSHSQAFSQPAKNGYEKASQLLHDFFVSSGIDMTTYSYRLYAESEAGEPLDDVTFEAPGDYFALFGTYLHRYTEDITLNVIAKEYADSPEDLQNILEANPSVEDLSDYANSKWNESGDFVIAIDNLDTGARILDNTDTAISWRH